MSKPFANPARGEVALSLGAHDFVLRPTFEALMQIEEELGSVFALIERVSENQVRLSDIVCVVWLCAVAGGADLGREDMGRLIVKDGMTKVTPAFRAVLLMALAGRQDGDETG